MKGRKLLICFVSCFLVLFAGVGVLRALGEADGVSAYKSNEYSACGSVFGNGDKVYLSVNEWQ